MVIYLIFYINFIIYNNRRARHFFVLNFYKLNITNQYNNIKRLYRGVFNRKNLYKYIQNNYK